ncbi:DEDD exonuclease domain-containing protein [uncultured Brevibacterium sp.]|uniref:DEDD exonuclease domain-containing protein n=1 Tax=uncultured Brevibacterium sp. TaxID=189678 RepID=UPI0025ED385C|nr:DEDD exonuclease domain-containing protein [uncultured Brevibacterium sp.]
MNYRFDRSASRGPMTFADLGTELHDVTFTVVDLETTGANATNGDITEIGAVKSCGGEIIGEFQTLVKPTRSVISPFVERLTGITNSMVATAPELSSVIPMFLEFAHGSTLVAHNAGFDIGFLREACARLDYPWPSYSVLDTVKLARLCVTRQEVRNHKLGTLATFFNAPTPPVHRALEDARATHHILQCMFERFGALGVTTFEELESLKPQEWKVRQSKKHLARDVPHAPGVYMFVDGSDRVLYVGSSRDMRSRVTSYFNAAESRGRMAEMVTAAQSIRTVVCPTELEARVREVRLIDELQPPHNRRSKGASRETWLKLTTDRFPRLSIARTPPAPGMLALGPFRKNASARVAKDLLERMYPLKRCTAKPEGADFRPCPSGEMGKCGGPCSGVTNRQDYLNGISAVTALLEGQPQVFVDHTMDHLKQLAIHERYEEAAQARDVAISVLRAGARGEQNSSVEESGRLAVAVATDHGFDVAVVQRGLLGASEQVPWGADLGSVSQSLALTAAQFPESHRGLAEERSLIYHWAMNDGAVLLDLEEPIAQPINGYQQALNESALGAPKILRRTDHRI